MWTEEQSWERDWWGNCSNTLSEELKQLSYFKRLGLTETANSKWRFAFDMGGKSVLDIGGGPCSFLLKCVNVQGTVADPCQYPDWVTNRYRASGIEYLNIKGEDLPLTRSFDEVWMYNLLQHVDDPEKIAFNAKKLGRTLRVFDWLDQGVLPGHPHNLTWDKMEKWFGPRGTVEAIDENDAKGKCFYGVFSA